jgi:hypothetical protein
MPNHVTNRLTFEGPADKIKELTEAYSTFHPETPRTSYGGGLALKHKKDEYKYCWKDDDGNVTHRTDEGVVPFDDYNEDDWEVDMVEAWTRFPDFDNVISMPSSLDCTSGSHGQLGYMILTKGEGAKNIRLPSEYSEYKKRFNSMSKKEQEEVLEAGRTYRYNVENHGYTSWYDWCCDKWGTKWNAYDCVEKECKYYFDTAWSPPTPVLLKMSENFPDVLIIHEFFDEGWNFWGIRHYKNGEGKEVHMGGGSDLDDVGHQLCLELKGYDADVEDEDYSETIV